MLNFSNLSIRRGKRELLHDASFTIHRGQKVGVTGANGVGKSSLFALIRNELHADAGDFSMPPATVIAHVAQETPATDKAAIEYVIDGDAELRTLQKKIGQAEVDNDGELLAHLYTDMEAIDGYTANSRAARLMHGLGFAVDADNRAVTDFSGGWRMRLNLAQALMCRSDLLLLDEPTNHLDLEAVIWLEDYLRAYPGTLLLISHDRDFLDRVCTHIAHIEQGTLNLYTGNYSAFEIIRAEKLANQQSQYEKQQREVARMQSFVDRFRAKATKARQAQSRIKALERMELISQAHVDSPFHFRFREPEKIPSLLLHLDETSAGYNDTVIISGVRLNITAGDRIGLLGHNGAGKSTLIKLLAGTIPAISGERTEAKDIKVGYFAQHQLELLDDNASPLLHLQRIDKKATESQLRDFLGGFNFTGDMALAPVAPFSGGEKARLVLAIVVYQKPNLLLLDEPTNHLDLEMRHALTTALQEFEGAMIIVSHDRHLLRTVTDTLLLVDNKQVTEFDGDLEDYRQWVRDSLNEDTDNSVTTNTNQPSKKQLRQQSAEKRQQLKPLRNKLQKLDKELASLQKKNNEIEKQLADCSIYDEANKDKLNAALLIKTELTKKIDSTEEEWLEISEQIDSAD